MVTNSIKKIVVFGGTGAQGAAVVKALTCDGRYQTCNPGHLLALKLAQLPNVTFHVGHIKSEDLLWEAMQGMDTVFFLANRFAIGEKAKLHWSIQAFKLACQLGIKLFQFSSLDYLPNKASFDPKFCCVHYDTKGCVAGKTVTSINQPIQHNITEIESVVATVHLWGEGKSRPIWHIEDIQAICVNNPYMFSDLEGWINNNKQDINDDNIEDHWTEAKIHMQGILICTK